MQAKIMHFYSFIPFFIKCTNDITSALNVGSNVSKIRIKGACTYQGHA